MEETPNSLPTFCSWGSLQPISSPSFEGCPLPGRQNTEPQHHALAGSSAPSFSYPCGINGNKTPPTRRCWKWRGSLAVLVAPGSKNHPRYPQCVASASGERGLIITWLLERCSPGEWPWHTLRESTAALFASFSRSAQLTRSITVCLHRFPPNECNKLIPGSEQMCLE